VTSKPFWSVRLTRGGQQQHYGGRPVRHVQSAMVVFDEPCVAPLFVAKRSPMHRSVSPLAGRPLPSPIAWFWTSGNPNNTLAGGPDGTQHTRQVVVGPDVLFVPPGPLDYVSSHMKHVKRRRMTRQRDVGRRRERRRKQQRLCHQDELCLLCA
jgi:hypothetical protein